MKNHAPKVTLEKISLYVNMASKRKRINRRRRFIILNLKRKTALLLFAIVTAMVLAACGDDKEGSDKVNDNESSNEVDSKGNGNEETQENEETDTFYQVGETGKEKRIKNT